MDEGRAALYAAIIGFAAAIIGAAVGGWASYKGARRSAEVSAQALADQVAEQARNEEAHWVRQERRQVYGRVFAAYSEYQGALSSLRRYDEPTFREACAQAIAAMRQLSDVCLEVNLFGPPTVAHDALALSVICDRRLESTLARIGIAQGDVTQEREVAAARSDEWEGHLAQALALFIRSSRGVFVAEPLDPPA